MTHEVKCFSPSASIKHANRIWEIYRGGGFYGALTMRITLLKVIYTGRAWGEFASDLFENRLRLFRRKKNDGFTPLSKNGENYIQMDDGISITLDMYKKHRDCSDNNIGKVDSKKCTECTELISYITILMPYITLKKYIRLI